jgi:hypothetical protein
LFVEMFREGGKREPGSEVEALDAELGTVDAPCNAL